MKIPKLSLKSANHLPASDANSPRGITRPAENVLALIHVLSSLIGRAFYGKVEIQHGLSIIEWRVMITLLKHPGLTAIEIINRWALQTMAASRAIRKLKRRGWIERQRKPADRRSYSLYLTEKGRQAYETVAPHANARYRDIIGCLTKAELAYLDRGLLKLIAHIKRLDN